MCALGKVMACVHWVLGKVVVCVHWVRWWCVCIG